MNPTRTSVVLMERRQASRVPANRGATIKFADRDVRCTVVDLSMGGAGLIAEPNTELPSPFFLLIDGEDQPRRCRVVWSDADRLGVAFD